MSCKKSGDNYEEERQRYEEELQKQEEEDKCLEGERHKECEDDRRRYEESITERKIVSEDWT